MDELLNSGVGSTPRHRNRTPRSEYERREDKGINVISIIILAAVIGAMTFLLTGCGAHRDVCGVTYETADSLQEIISQTTIVSSGDTAVTHTTTESQHTEDATATTTEDDTETITEHITEVTDSTGTTTRTIDRTTTRKHNATATQTSFAQTYAREESLNVYLSYLDSVCNAMMEREAYHTYFADSTRDITPPQQRTTVRTLWESFLDMVEGLFIGAALLLIIYLGYKYMEGR